jgi:arsenate reductase (thioredoxin)
MKKIKVLFLCTGNSARSQMAEALLKKYGGDGFEAHSAGLDPKTINPLTVAVLEEIGIDISDQYSKGVKEYLGRVKFDDAVIVCRRAEENCPTLLPDAKRVHRWIFEDPAKAEGTPEEKLAKFREVRNQIEARLKLWLAETAEAEGLDVSLA